MGRGEAGREAIGKCLSKWSMTTTLNGSDCDSLWKIPLEMQREMQWEIGDVARRGGKSKSKSQLVVATIVRCITRVVAAAATTIVVT